MRLLAPVALLCAMNATGPASAAQQAATPATGQQAVVAYRLPPAVPPETTAIPVRRLKVLDSEMAYRTVGDGEPVLFIHGNPTSSYLWRNVMPYVAGERQAIAVDLIGMGDSGKPRIAYRFVDHMRYLEAFVSALGLQRITLVGHDWGAALAWEYARRHPERVQRLAFMEGVLPPAFPKPSFEAMGEKFGGMFRAFKDEVEGYRMVVTDNMFVEGVLPQLVNRPLGETAMTAYRAPFRDPADRAPVLAWPRQVPIAGDPADTEATLETIGAFMGQTAMPVLLLYAEPGVLVPPQAVGWYVERIPRLETAFVGQGLHFIQEDQPDAIGRALRDWIRRN